MSTRQSKWWATLGPLRSSTPYIVVAVMAFAVTLAPRAARAVVASWGASQATTYGPLLGSEHRHATVIVEFADYECPACAVADSVLQEHLRRGNLAIRFHHLPLKAIHQHAWAAALASECAAAQRPFEEMHHTLFRNQRKLGQVPWTTLALQAGVRDTAAFASCMKAAQPAARIEADLKLARHLRLRGTPAFVVDGAVYYGVPTDSILRSWVGTP